MQPPKISEQYSWWCCRLLPPNRPPDPHWEASRIFILQVGCCVSLHPSGGAEYKATPFLIHAGSASSVSTICVPFLCHAQSLAETNRVTGQLNWLTVVSFFMSCSITWMASLIDNLYLLDLIVLVINWQHVNSKSTVRGDPQETLCRVRSPILFVRSVILSRCVTTMRPRGLSDLLVPAPGRSSSVAATQSWVDTV